MRSTLFRKKAASFLELPYTADLSDRQVVVDRQATYLGHPDLVETDDGRLIVAYPSGHGRGKIIMKTSDDFGKTWSARREGLPASWDKSQETPTVYNLHFSSGKTKLVLISGCPHWDAGVRDGKFLPEMFPNGFNFSYSDDGGKTWSEFENFYSPMNATVCMSSLTRLKENGKFVDKWMGTFHEQDFTNYKSILTFNEDGKAHWSKPVPFLAPHCEIEKRVGICEIEIIRSDKDVLILIARGETRKTRSVISLSYDEGETWTAPKELPYLLCGDRHKAAFDKTSGKVIVSFRQFIPEKRSLFSLKKGVFDGWAAWIGTFDDLISFASEEKPARYGEKLYLLGKNYGNWYDCGYNGIVTRDGKALLVTYGAFDKNSATPYIVATELDMTK